MSGRESCVWHPMPEEVRRSSVQSRRASLAAGRRKRTNNNAPDWEVEAAPQDGRAVASIRSGSAATSHGREAAANSARSGTPAAAASARSGTPPLSARSGGAVRASAMAEADGTAGKGRTRHTVRFHGENWTEVLKKQKSEIEKAFLSDILDCADVSAKDATRLKIKMRDCMEMTFVVQSESRERQQKIHTSLQSYAFPKTCHVYTTFSA